MIDDKLFNEGYELLSNSNRLDIRKYDRNYTYCHQIK